jgi:hypothetical protein
MHQKDEPDLRLKARAAIFSNAMPHRRPDHTFGGPGNGAPCPICGSTLATSQMVFDLEFADAGGRMVNCQVHVRCFAAWEQEREESEDEERLQSNEAEHTLQDSERAPSSSGLRK